MSLDKQRTILNFVRGHPEPVKRSEIIDTFGHWYHHNAGKWISEILYRMVQNGKLQKPKHGYYSLGSGVKKATTEQDKNQLNLF